LPGKSREWRSVPARVHLPKTLEVFEANQLLNKGKNWDC